LRLVTSYGECDDGLTAAIDWRFPANERKPLDAVNAMMVAHYNGKGDPPYLYIVKEGDKQVGLFVADVSNIDGNGNVTTVDVSGDAGLAIFKSILSEEAASRGATLWRARGREPQTVWREDLGIGLLRWELPEGQVFPAECLNAVLYGMYKEGVRPCFYPVFDSMDDSGLTPQIGVLLSPYRDESGTGEQFARKVREDFDGLMSFPSEVKVLPWDQEVFEIV